MDQRQPAILQESELHEIRMLEEKLNLILVAYPLHDAARGGRIANMGDAQETLEIRRSYGRFPSTEDDRGLPDRLSPETSLDDR